MRWLLILWCFGVASGGLARAQEGKLLKVLPQFLDKQGRSAVSPSLYDRDAYQALLRRNPGQRSTLRFAVEWKAGTPDTQPLKLRVEMRGATGKAPPSESTLEATVRQHGWFSHWTNLTLSPDDYLKFGEVTAWRVTLWKGDRLLSEEKSFLW
jgi:hypothetical protein